MIREARAPMPPITRTTAAMIHSTGLLSAIIAATPMLNAATMRTTEIHAPAWPCGPPVSATPTPSSPDRYSPILAVDAGGRGVREAASVDRRHVGADFSEVPELRRQPGRDVVLPHLLGGGGQAPLPLVDGHGQRLVQRVGHLLDVEGVERHRVVAEFLVRARVLRQREDAVA